MDKKDVKARAGKTLPRSPFPPFLAPLLDNPLRRLVINREKFLRNMGVREGHVVLEVGCGPGFFTEVLSRIVAEKGVVFAQDVEEAMIGRVEEKVSRLGLGNVRPLLCDSRELELPDMSCDAVLCLNVIEEIYKEGALEESVREIIRVLKTPGLIVIREHRPGGTARMVRECEGLLERAGLKKDLEGHSLFSYFSRLIRKV